ncbi:hypothetical protein Ais01nite_74820 [Asanoa ishikariensis]|uniref:Lysophospholipase L1 n=1 Tax=Asanoa ishikariensis TaxID=137265 RepID=A0A1H3USC8_9ACTN|nr:GDSL-type esterase/lipase family protein [Asanoa ishikariensis]GIF69447.1 hypothetical protein Ais01nite_74820 [Asanoa ishikariensis]SDZ65353.1 Lysophospholipase L1 [Asanoa ishikariensis]
MIWTAGFRSAVISPYEQVKLSEPRGFADQTVRQVLHLAGGGQQFRVRLTNRFGHTALTIGAGSVTTEGGQAVLTFDGAETGSIPPGQEVVGDPITLPVEAGDGLVLSLYFPEETGLATYSHKPAQLAHVVPGEQVTSPRLNDSEQVEARFYVSGIDVLSSVGNSIAVAFGDSWFEGVGSTVGANNRSVDFLNRRLDKGWVVNQGIAGNRLLTDEVGQHALRRFDRDVLSVPGTTHVLVHFGINDLGLPGMFGEPPAAADALVAGFTELAARAHAAELKILVATIGPFGGAIYPGISTPEALATRRMVNDWIRTTDTFDGVFDVAAAVANPNAPDFLHPALDSGDGMHLNDDGAREMANTVDLNSLS